MPGSEIKMIFNSADFIEVTFAFIAEHFDQLKAFRNDVIRLAKLVIVNSQKSTLKEMFDLSQSFSDTETTKEKKLMNSSGNDREELEEKWRRVETICKILEFDEAGDYNRSGSKVKKKPPGTVFGGDSDDDQDFLNAADCDDRWHLIEFVLDIFLNCKKQNYSPKTQNKDQENSTQEEVQSPVEGNSDDFLQKVYQNLVSRIFKILKKEAEKNSNPASSKRVWRPPDIMRMFMIIRELISAQIFSKFYTEEFFKESLAPGLLRQARDSGIASTLLSELSETLKRSQSEPGVYQLIHKSFFNVRNLPLLASRIMGETKTSVVNSDLAIKFVRVMLRFQTPSQKIQNLSPKKRQKNQHSEAETGATEEVIASATPEYILNIFNNPQKSDSQDQESNSDQKEINRQGLLTTMIRRTSLRMLEENSMAVGHFLVKSIAESLVHLDWERIEFTKMEANWMLKMLSNGRYVQNKLTQQKRFSSILSSKKENTVYKPSHEITLFYAYLFKNHYSTRFRELSPKTANFKIEVGGSRSTNNRAKSGSLNPLIATHYLQVGPNYYFSEFSKIFFRIIFSHKAVDNRTKRVLRRLPRTLIKQFFDSLNVLEETKILPRLAYLPTNLPLKKDTLGINHIHHITLRGLDATLISKFNYQKRYCQPGSSPRKITLFSPNGGISAIKSIRDAYLWRGGTYFTAIYGEKSRKVLCWNMVINRYKVISSGNAGDLYGIAWFKNGSYSIGVFRKDSEVDIISDWRKMVMPYEDDKVTVVSKDKLWMVKKGFLNGCDFSSVEAARSGRQGPGGSSRASEEPFLKRRFLLCSNMWLKWDLDEIQVVGFELAKTGKNNVNGFFSECIHSVGAGFEIAKVVPLSEETLTTEEASEGKSVVVRRFLVVGLFVKHALVLKVTYTSLETWMTRMKLDVVIEGKVRVLEDGEEFISLLEVDDSDDILIVYEKEAVTEPKKIIEANLDDDAGDDGEQPGEDVREDITVPLSLQLFVKRISRVKSNWKVDKKTGLQLPS